MSSWTTPMKIRMPPIGKIVPSDGTVWAGCHAVLSTTQSHVPNRMTRPDTTRLPAETKGLARITTPDAAGPTVGANCRGVFAAIAIRDGLRKWMEQSDVEGNGNELGTRCTQVRALWER